MSNFLASRVAKIAAFLVVCSPIAGYASLRPPQQIANEPREKYESWLDALLCASAPTPTSDVADSASQRPLVLAQATVSGTGGFAPDDRERPGDSTRGNWAGLISPPDAVSAGPGQGQWLTKAGLPTSRSEVAVAGLNGKVYVFGGYANGYVDQSLVEEYDPKTDTWRKRADMPKGGNHLGAVGYEGKLYVFGGFERQNHAAYADSFVMDEASNIWKRIAPLPQPLASMGVAVLDGKIHVVGGATGISFADRHTVDTHYVYDIKSNTWSEGLKLPLPREHFNLIVLDRKMYVIGGRIENFSQNLATVYVLDAADPKPKWSALALMPTARSGTAAAVLAGKIFVFGGEQFGGVFNKSEMYDPATGRWSTLTPMPIGRHGFGAVTVDDAIYMPAGGPLNGGAAQTNANQSFSYP